MVLQISLKTLRISSMVFSQRSKYAHFIGGISLREIGPTRFGTPAKLPLFFPENYDTYHLPFVEKARRFYSPQLLAGT